MRDSKEIDIPGLTIALYRIESAIAKESASIHESEASK